MVMASVSPTTMDAEGLSKVDRAILDELHQGARTKGYLVDHTGFSRNSVYNRLEVLEAAGFVECIHESTRLFKLREDPREN